MDDMARDSPVLGVRVRVEFEEGRWVVWMDAITIPDREDYVISHRLGDYASREQAGVAARWMRRGAEKF